MPPKDKNASTLKQTTLKGFFGKAPQPSSSSSSSPSTSSRVAPSKQPVTPASKTRPTNGDESSSVPSSATKTPSSQPSSALGSSIKKQKAALSTPVAMSVDDEDDGVEVVISATTKKRKVADQFSDEDDEPTTGSFAEKLVGFKRGPDTKKPPKRPRSTILLSDDEEDGVSQSETQSVGTSSSARSSSALLSDDDDDDDVITSKKGKPPPPKKSTNGKAKRVAKYSGASESEDDFVVSDNDDGDEDVEMGEVEDEDDDAPKAKSKPKKASSSKAKAKSSASASKERPALAAAGSSSSTFLTAAEQRAQAQKKDKKSNEEAYSFLKIRKDKDGNLPDSPKFDPRTLYIPKSAWSTFTPFEKQFWEIKQYHFDTVLFFQKGKFYELYENDAEIGHAEFDLKLTDRVKMKMVGVPESSFDFWAAKFLAQGYKVGRVDQSETQLGSEMRQAKSKTKGPKEIVRRELGKILTNGTLVDANMLQDEQAGHLVSIREDGDGDNSFGLCILDASTGEFNISTFIDDVCGTKLETIIRQLRPKEILFTKGNLSVSTNRLLKALLPSSCVWSGIRASEGLAYDDTLLALDELYPRSDDEMTDGDAEPGSSPAIPDAIRGVVNIKVAVEALGNMIWYLRTLNLDKDILTMKNFNIYDPMRQGKALILDGQTLSHIEILRNSEGTDEGSLLKLLSNCLTPFGKRLFRIWLCMPLRDIKAINERLDAVDDLMDNPSFEANFTSLAKGMPDLERIVARIHAGSCKPKDFLRVLAHFRLLSEGLAEMATTSEGFKSRSVFGLLRSAPDLEPYVANMESLFEPPDQDAAEFMPVPGKHEEFDAIEAEIKQVDKDLKRKLETLRKQYPEESLSFWHSNVGTKDVYLVESKTAKGFPNDWKKSSSSKNKTKWEVPALAGLIRQFKEAQETRKQIIKDFKLRVYADFDSDRTIWLSAVKIMAELDCLFSLAKSSSSLDKPSCRPQFVEANEAFVDFEDLRHPSIAIKNTFIPNNIKLGGKAERIMLLTGPNMGGKSTAMRMTAVGVIMAQLGMYVPAKRARLAPVDAILTRMGAYDNMFSNASTFKVEMDECCKILREATPRSLVILDELGRGTSTYDGMAIAGAVLHQLATHTLPLCCFATHYSSLTDDYAYHPNIRNMHMGTIIDEEERKLVFTYKLTEGVSEGSFGTHVASLAGVPSPVVKRADEISKDFAEQFRARLEEKRLASSRVPLMTQADFAFLVNVATAAPTSERNKGKDGDSEKMNQILDVLAASVQSSLKLVK